MEFFIYLRFTCLVQLRLPTIIQLLNYGIIYKTCTLITNNVFTFYFNILLKYYTSVVLCLMVIRENRQSKMVMVITIKS